MAKIQMQFKKGDTQVHYFQIEEGAWSAGGMLWFAAKPSTDNDASDASAVINKSFNDAVIVDSSHSEYLEGYVTYLLEFVPDDIDGVTYTNGEKVKKYLGEFEYVSSTGAHSSFPPDDDYIEVLIYSDIKRGAV